MTRYFAIVSYDGSNYRGFQRQNNALGIQTVIERALFNMIQQEVLITPSGRTDKGVHAIGQTFHFDLPVEIVPSKMKDGLNYRLPPDVRIKSVKKVSSNFHARYDAKSKIYRFYFAKRPSNVFDSRLEVYYENLNDKVIEKLLPNLVGTHDFRGFAKTNIDQTNTIRTIYQAEIKETAKHYIITIHGDGFLKYQIRSIIGTIAEISIGKKEFTVLDEILKTKNRQLAGKTIEGKGLYLIKVLY